MKWKCSCRQTFELPWRWWRKTRYDLECTRSFEASRYDHDCNHDVNYGTLCWKKIDWYRLKVNTSSGSSMALLFGATCWSIITIIEWNLLILNYINSFKDVNINNKMLSLWLYWVWKLQTLQKKIHNPPTWVIQFFCNSFILKLHTHTRSQRKHLIL